MHTRSEASVENFACAGSFMNQSYSQWERFTCSSQTIAAELGHNQTLSRYFSHVMNPETEGDSQKDNGKIG